MTAASWGRPTTDCLNPSRHESEWDAGECPRCPTWNSTCDGCSVSQPREHRCDRDRCPCPECHPPNRQEGIHPHV